MKIFAALVLLVSCVAHADGLTIQKGDTDNLNLAFGGDSGGATEELLSYMVKGGITPHPDETAISYYGTNGFR